MLLFCQIYIQCRWLICDASKTAILTLSSNRFIHTGFTAGHGARGVPVGYIQWPTGYLGFQFLLVILAIFFYFPPSERRWAMHCISATCWKDNGGMGCLGCRWVAVVDLEQNLWFAAWNSKCSQLRPWNFRNVHPNHGCCYNPRICSSVKYAFLAMITFVDRLTNLVPATIPRIQCNNACVCMYLRLLRSITLTMISITYYLCISNCR